MEQLIAELDALYEKATKGPWRIKHDHDPDEDHAHIQTTDGEPIAIVEFGESDKDAELIVALVNHWPAIKQGLSTARAEAFEEAAKVCEEKGKHWQSLNPNIISPVACAAADCADAIRALKERP